MRLQRRWREGLQQRELVLRHPRPADPGDRGEQRRRAADGDDEYRRHHDLGVRCAGPGGDGDAEPQRHRDLHHRLGVRCGGAGRADGLPRRRGREHHL